jgi:DNA-binding HxlR family transcriptional regulator
MPKGGPTPSFKRSDCPIACALDLLGDKWTLLILRDLFLGYARYGELQSAGEGIPTNVLAERLNRLVAAGIVVKRGSRPRVTYHLTPKGRSLGPVIRGVEAWGLRWIPGTRSRKTRRVLNNR